MRRCSSCRCWKGRPRASSRGWNWLTNSMSSVSSRLWPTSASARIPRAAMRRPRRSGRANPCGMKHIILFYDYVPDYLERRGGLRAAHFAHAVPAVERGELFLAGACTDEGPPLGVLVFKTENRETVEAF